MNQWIVCFKGRALINPTRWSKWHLPDDIGQSAAQELFKLPNRSFLIRDLAAGIGPRALAHIRASSSNTDLADGADRGRAEIATQMDRAPHLTFRNGIGTAALAKPATLLIAEQTAPSGVGVSSHSSGQINVSD